MEKSLQILKQYWGYDTFRALQSEIVTSAIEGIDTLALLPTGGGKSICFQVPALAREGICIVVSPLLALMEDQVENLNKRNIRSYYLGSNQSFAEMDRILDNCLYGEVKFLYISPERIHNELFIERCKRMKVALIAVDEAHCISQWGHDFRPAYRKIESLRELHPDTPLIAVTATANEQVQQDIIEQLKLKDHQFFKGSYHRSNLHFNVIQTEKKEATLLKILNKVQGSGIIYAPTRRKTKEIARILHSAKISSNFYHAGLSSETKTQLLNDWQQDKLRVIASTNAFGMGIDKANVRSVSHLHLPPSPEEFIQEAGRAGRDGKESKSILILHESDIETAHQDIASRFPEQSFIRDVYTALGNHFGIAYGAGQEQVFSFDIASFCDHYKWKTREVFEALNILELCEYISMSKGMKTPSKFMFTATKEQLYDIQIKSKENDFLIRIMTRTYGGIFESHVSIDEQKIAGLMKCKLGTLVNRLKQFDEMGFAEYFQRNNLPTLLYLSGRMKSNDLVFKKEILENRKNQAQEKLEFMIAFASTSTCRAKFILKYFGEELKKDCGSCDNCLAKKNSPMSFDEIRNEIEQLLNDQSLSVEGLVNAIGEFHRTDILQCIRTLMDEGILSKNADDLIISLS